MIRKAKKFYESQGLGKTLEELKIDTQSLLANGPPLTGTSIASTNYDDTKSETSISKNIDQPIEVCTDVHSIAATGSQQHTPSSSSILATPPINMSGGPRRRSSSSNAAFTKDSLDSSSHHSIKTRSTRSGLAVNAGTSSKLNTIEDEPDSNPRKRTSDCDSSSIGDVSKEEAAAAVGAASSSGGNVSASTTSAASGAGVNRRTNFFKRNKSNVKLN